MTVAYDITRLLWRSLSPGPNGIDRIDLNLATHFLDGRQSHQGMLLNRFGPVAFENHDAAALLDLVRAAWSETDNLTDQGAYGSVLNRLLARADESQGGRTQSASSMRRRANAARLAFKVLRQIAGIRKPLPQNAVFLHTTQFPAMRMFRWLDGRPDIAPVFFVHDLLPLHHPDWFTKRNADWHRKFIDVFLRYGCAAIVNTNAVAGDVRNLLTSRQGRDLPILVAPMPAAPIFAKIEPPDLELRAVPYFIICGTIEPRKNHQLILQIWEKLLQRDGMAAPKLVIAGRRGWRNEEVFRTLDRMSSHSHIIEAPGLSTAALRRLMANACALLMPSLGEGYGLPVVEARAAGAPVIASDIPAFREIADDEVTYCDNRDSDSWLRAIQSHVECREPRLSPETRARNNALAWEKYFDRLERFLAERRQ